MLGVNLSIEPGICEVHTTEYRGFTPEEIAERAVTKIVSVADGADPVVIEQAEAFKRRVFYVIVKACKDAIQSDRTTVYNALLDAVEPKLADLIRRL